MKRRFGASRTGKVAWAPLLWVIWGRTHPSTDQSLRWHHGRPAIGKRYEFRWDWHGRFFAVVLGPKPRI